MATVNRISAHWWPRLQWMVWGDAFVAAVTASLDVVRGYRVLEKMESAGCRDEGSMCFVVEKLRWKHVPLAWKRSLGVTSLLRVMSRPSADLQIVGVSVKVLPQRHWPLDVPDFVGWNHEVWADAAKTIFCADKTFKIPRVVPMAQAVGVKRLPMPGTFVECVRRWVVQGDEDGAV